MVKALALAVLIILTACTAIEDHGIVPAAVPNLPPGDDDGLEVRAEMVEYHDGVRGYFARPADNGTYPGVVMIHEWWGLNDNIKAMAEQLAAEGYLVLAVDLFNGQVATTPAQARSLTGGFNQTQGLGNMRSAADYLRTQGATRMASLGWCFGGAQSLQLALDEDLDATVIYYGQLVTEEERLEALEQPLLGIFGEEDRSIPPSRVREFDDALDTTGTEHEIIIYPGVGHAFANPSGDNYSPEEAEDAWRRTTAFLAEHLK